MANGGKNSNTSQYFITLAPLAHLSGKHVVFGRVVSGMEVVQRLEQYHATHGDGEGWKISPPFVWDCGVE
jgi:cyclophilin family peptidyl-prolyl cis-trans isomerase